MVAAIHPGGTPETPRLSAAEQYRLRGLGGVPTAASTSIRWKMEEAPRPTSPSPAHGAALAPRRKSLGDAVFGRRAGPESPITVKISSPILQHPISHSRPSSPVPSSMDVLSAEQAGRSPIKRKPVPKFANVPSLVRNPPQNTSSLPASPLETIDLSVLAPTAAASRASELDTAPISPLHSDCSESESDSTDSPSVDSIDSFAFFEAPSEPVSTDDEKLLVTPILAYSSRAESPSSQDEYTSEDEKSEMHTAAWAHAPLQTSVFIEQVPTDRERAPRKLAIVRDLNLEPGPLAPEVASRPAATRVAQPVIHSAVDPILGPRSDLRSKSPALSISSIPSIQQRRSSLATPLTVATSPNGAPQRLGCGSESDSFTSSGTTESVCWTTARAPSPTDEADLDSDACEVALEAECAPSIGSPEWDGTFTGDTEEFDRTFTTARRSSTAELFPWSVPVVAGETRRASASAAPSSRFLPSSPTEVRRPSMPTHTYSKPRRASEVSMPTTPAASLRQSTASLFSRVRGSAVTFAPSFGVASPSSTTLHEFFTDAPAPRQAPQPTQRRFSLQPLLNVEPSWLRSDTPVFPSFPSHRRSQSSVSLFSNKPAPAPASPTSSSSSDSASFEGASSTSSFESLAELSKA